MSRSSRPCVAWAPSAQRTYRDRPFLFAEALPLPLLLASFLPVFLPLPNSPHLSLSPSHLIYFAVPMFFPSSAFGFLSFFTSCRLSMTYLKLTADTRLLARLPHPRGVLCPATSAPLCPSPFRIPVASCCLYTLPGSCKTELLCPLFPMPGGPSLQFSTQSTPLPFSSTQEASSPPEALPGGPSCSCEMPAHGDHRIFHIILNMSTHRVLSAPWSGCRSVFATLVLSMGGHRVNAQWMFGVRWS